jgi:hypothetical protein
MEAKQVRVLIMNNAKYTFTKHQRDVLDAICNTNDGAIALEWFGTYEAEAARELADAGVIVVEDGMAFVPGETDEERADYLARFVESK